ncbi:hypothetical protein ABZ853_09875 [Streptomyces albidoflavus]
MSSADADGEERWTQRRVSARGATLLLPRVLLVAALADLVWEIVKANLDSPLREEWPWRLIVLDALHLCRPGGPADRHPRDPVPAVADHATGPDLVRVRGPQRPTA